MWLEWLSENVAPLSAEGYARDVRLYVEWRGEAVGPVDITRVDVAAYVAHLRASDYAPATINRRIEALRAYVRFGIESGALSVDPLERIENLALAEGECEWLERKEWGRIERELEIQRNGARSEFARRVAVRDMAVAMVLRYAGLRVAEVCALELGDVLLAAERAEVLVRNGKGGKPRVVPLHREARQALAEWLAVRPNGGDEFVFIGKRGEPLEPRGVQRRLAEYARKAGVHCTPHTLRHTFAHELVTSGAPLTVVMKLLGHARMDTTAIYAKPGKKDLQNAVEAMP